MKQQFRIPISLPELGEACEIDGFVAVPVSFRELSPVVVCLPGGSYTAASYYDLEIVGQEGYSMADVFNAAGITVVGLNHLGTGTSSRPRRHDLVDARLAARADHMAVEWIVQRLRAGDLLPGATPVAGPLIGIGHSMGSGVLMVQQATRSTFDAVALLGMTSFAGFGSGGAAQDHDSSVEAAEAAIRASSTDESWNDGYYQVRPETGLDHFYLDDVPPEVVRVDRSLATTIPRSVAIDIAAAGFLTPFAAAIRVPVFLGFGEVDLSPQPHQEPSNFDSSGDITLFVLAGSGHCHNLAGTRRELWSRLLGWIGSIDPATRAVPSESGK